MAGKISALFAKKLNASLKTERLLIEPLVELHAQYFFVPMQNIAIYEWISAKPPPSLHSLKTSWSTNESRLNPECNKAWLGWAVRRASDGAYIGKMDAEINIELIATNIGYLFFPEYWGQGYASEALTAVTNHLHNCGIFKILAAVTEGNRASYRVLEKSGYVRNRIIIDNDTIRGVKYNDIEFIKVGNYASEKK